MSPIIEVLGILFLCFMNYKILVRSLLYKRILSSTNQQRGSFLRPNPILSTYKPVIEEIARSVRRPRYKHLREPVSFSLIGPMITSSLTLLGIVWLALHADLPNTVIRIMLLVSFLPYSLLIEWSRSLERAILLLTTDASKK